MIRHFRHISLTLLFCVSAFAVGQPQELGQAPSDLDFFVSRNLNAPSFHSLSAGELVRRLNSTGSEAGWLFSEMERKHLQALVATQTAETLHVRFRDQNAKKTFFARHPTLRLSYHWEPRRVIKTSQAFGSARDLRNLQWGFSNSGDRQLVEYSANDRLWIPGKSGHDIGIAGATPEPTDSYRPIIAVLDTGIDLAHPDLADALISRARPDLKQKECQALADYHACLVSPDRRTCDERFMRQDHDGNGYPLDCNGWNVVPTLRNGDLVPVNPVSGILGNPIPQDLSGHGTHVAGLIAAKDDASGTRGVSARAALLAVRVIRGDEPSQPINPQNSDLPPPSEASLNPGGKLSSLVFADMIVRGMLYAIRSRADVIHLSLSWTPLIQSSVTTEIFEIARNRGIFVVAAAGNDAHDGISFPCALKGVVCVGASANNGAIAHFSNFGPGVDLVAPGLRMLSTFPTRLSTKRFKGVEGYEFMNGTSMSAPLVSGAIARMIATGIPRSEIYARLMLGSRPLSRALTPSTVGPFARGGHLDVRAALDTKLTPLWLASTKIPAEIDWNGVSRELSFEISLTNVGAPGVATSFTLEFEPHRSQNPVPKLSVRKILVPVGATQSEFKYRVQATLPETEFPTLQELESHYTLRLVPDHFVESAAIAPLRFPIRIGVLANPENLLALGAKETKLPELASDNELRSVYIQGIKADPARALVLTANRANWKLRLAEDGRTERLIELPTKSIDLVYSRINSLDLIRSADGTPELALILALEQNNVRSPLRFVRFSTSSSPAQILEDITYDHSIAGWSERYQWIKQGSSQRPVWITIGKPGVNERPRAYDPWNPADLQPQDVRLYFLEPGKSRPSSLAAPKGYRAIQLLDAPAIETISRSASHHARVLLTGDETGAFTRYAISEFSLDPPRFSEPVALDLRVENDLSRTLNLTPVFSLVSGTRLGTAFHTASNQQGSLDTSALFWQDGRVQGKQLRSQTPSLYEALRRGEGAFIDRDQTLWTWSRSPWNIQLSSESTRSSTNLKRFTFLPEFAADNGTVPLVLSHPSDARAKLPGLYRPAFSSDTTAITVFRGRPDHEGRIEQPARLRIVPTRQCPEILDPSSIEGPEQKTRFTLVCDQGLFELSL